MKQELAVIIGGNRGIGLGFVEEYLAQGYLVIATYRNAERLAELNHLSQLYTEQLRLFPLDVRDESAIKALAEEIKVPVNILVLNAGVIQCIPGSHPLRDTTQEIRETMEVNTYAPDNIIRALFPSLLHPHSCVVYLSSTLSSTVHNLKGRYSSYRVSKAAANIMIQNWNIELASQWCAKDKPLNERPCAFPISPGLVKTDMGGGRGDLTVEESVSQMVTVIAHVRDHKRCSFYLYDGSILQEYPEPLLS